MYVVHEGHVLGGGWLLVVGGRTSPETCSLKLLREAITSTHVSLSHALVSLGLAVGGAWAMLGSWEQMLTLGAHPPQQRVSNKVSPRVDGGHPDSAPRGGRALAVRGGEPGALVSGDVEEGVEEKVSDALPQGCRLDQSGRPDALGGTAGVEAQHLLVSETLEVLPYRCRVV